jgi:hypothetical protein
MDHSSNRGINLVLKCTQVIHFFLKNVLSFMRCGMRLQKQATKTPLGLVLPQ